MYVYIYVPTLGTQAYAIARECNILQRDLMDIWG